MALWTLDRSLDVDRFDENNRTAFRSCRIKGLEVRERLIVRSRAKRVIFKPVCDSHNTSRLLSEHEDARAVWVYRDFRDVANSAVARWGEMNLSFIRELLRGGGDWGRHQWNRELMTPERRVELERLVEDDLNAHGAAAIFWYMVGQSFFDQGLDANRQCIVARYEDLVTRPVPEFRRLCDFLEIGFHEDMVAWIFTSSVRRRSSSPISDRVTEACEAMLARLDRVREGRDPNGVGVPREKAPGASSR